MEGVRGARTEDRRVKQSIKPANNYSVSGLIMDTSSFDTILLQLSKSGSIGGTDHKQLLTA